MYKCRYLPRYHSYAQPLHMYTLLLIVFLLSMGPFKILFGKPLTSHLLPTYPLCEFPLSHLKIDVSSLSGGISMYIERYNYTTMSSKSIPVNHTPWRVLNFQTVPCLCVLLRCHSISVRGWLKKCKCWIH